MEHDGRRHMLKHLKLVGVGPAPVMELSLAPRLNLLTGDNGLGKTFILDVAWWALTRTWAGPPAWPQRGVGAKPAIHYRVENGKHAEHAAHFDFASQTWKIAGPPPSPGLVLYVRVDGSFSLWDPARNHGSVKARVREMGEQAALPPAYHFSPATLWNGLSEGNQIYCNGLFRDWVLWQLQKSEAFEQLCAVLKALSADEREPLVPGPPTRVSISDVRDIPTLEMPYGTVPIVHASAGAQRILGLAYLLVWAWQEHRRAAALLNQEPTTEIILLVDEIEAHLHPQWQRAILPALLAVAAGLGAGGMRVQVLSTTHAPLVLASVEPLFDEARDDLFHFDLRGERVTVESGGWAKQGDALNWLVSEVFGLHQARSREAERAIEAAEAFMSGERDRLPPGLRTQKAIHEELLRLLPGHDPFWPRWIVDAEKVRKVTRTRRR
jgi:hypothetical protein